VGVDRRSYFRSNLSRAFKAVSSSRSCLGAGVVVVDVSTLVVVGFVSFATVAFSGLVMAMEMVVAVAVGKVEEVAMTAGAASAAPCPATAASFSLAAASAVAFETVVSLAASVVVVMCSRLISRLPRSSCLLG